MYSWYRSTTQHFSSTTHLHSHLLVSPSTFSPSQSLHQIRQLMSPLIQLLLDYCTLHQTSVLTTYWTLLLGTEWVEAIHIILIRLYTEVSKYLSVYKLALNGFSTTAPQVVTVHSTLAFSASAPIFIATLNVSTLRGSSLLYKCDTYTDQALMYIACSHHMYNMY